MKQQLDPVLSALADDAPFDVASGGVMEGVWERVGAINARRERTMRSAMFVSLFAVGLGVGAATVQPPAYAQETSYQIFNEARLSPAALLHVNP